MNDEVKEWFGLTKADGVLYIGFGMLGAMFFVRNGAFDIILAAGAVILSIWSCFLGMKPKDEFMKITNVAKQTGYPVGVLMMLGIIVYHYVWFGKG